MSLFPIFVKLQNKRCLVVGGGPVAEGKIESLLNSAAEVLVVSPTITETIADWHRSGAIRYEPRKFEPRDLTGSWLVIAATSSTEVNDEVFREAEAHGVLCNAVDDPERCHFYYPAVVQRGALQIAISTSGYSPALAQRLRKDLEQQFGPEYEAWLEWLNAARQAISERSTDPEERKELLHSIATNHSFQMFLQLTEDLTPLSEA